LVLSALQRLEIPLDPLLGGLPVSKQELQRLGERVDWEVWAELMLRVEAAVGGPAAFEEFSLLTASVPGLHQFQRVAQLFSSPLSLYRLNSRWGVPNQYRHMRSTYDDLGAGQIRVSVTMPETYPGCLPAFRAAAGVLRGLPKLIGLPESRVIAREISPHRACLILEPPRSRTLWSHARQLGRRLRGLESMLDQLGQQELELDAKREVLEQQLVLQKQVEAALRGSEERWRGLAQNAPGTIALMSARGEIESISRAFHGVEPEALQGRLLFELFALPQRAELELAMHEARTELRQRDVQLFVAGPATGGTWYSCRLGPMCHAAEPVRLSAFLLDITLSMRAEQLLKEREVELSRAQKMEALGLLAGGVAHDFNNLLTVIVGGADLLLERSSAVSAEQLELLEIRRAGERAAHLTRQLLAFSRQQVINPEVMNLAGAIEDFKGMLTRLIGEDIQLRMLPDPASWYVKLDVGQVEQILINLAVNARDAMPRGGRLTLATHNLELDVPTLFGGTLASPGQYVELSVEDTGLGMDDATRARIFEPFYTTKHTGRGTGLGLAIVRGITSQNDGHVLVGSELGRGSSFRLLFPRSHESPRAKPESKPARARGGFETILLVEDDVQVRALTSKILIDRGYDVIECGGAAEALARADARVIDLLLSDVIMPEISGPELARLLTEKYPDLAVLFMSGYAEHEVLHSGVVNPGVSLIPKPFGPEALACRVRERLDQRGGQQRSELESG
jgi:PAS domain S-box-containing protein